MVRVLLVEDDLDLLDVTAYMLRRERFAVIEASNGAQALRRFKADRPELVVLDLGIPPPDGFEVLRRIREENDTPVLVVTGRLDREDRIRCFNLGTDDFIAKPYAYRELALRIRALLRRGPSAVREESEPRLELGDLRLDPEIHEVERGSTVVRLTPTEFRILYALAKNAGHVVPATRLFSYVWGSDGGDANSLRSHICHLRKKLGFDGGARGAISSVPAVGYLLTVANAPPLAARADDLAYAEPASSA
jgi:DNA-binding response OmpR family regulator